MLYSFSKLGEKLDQLGYPIIRESGFRSIRIDFNAETFKKAIKEGGMKFSKDGIYLTYEGKEWKGYMYMPTYRINQFNSMPRFHLTRCEKIEELFSGGYGLYYKWSNNPSNNITDRDTKEIYEDQVLQLCSYCQNSIIGLNNTEDFFETLETEDSQLVENIDVDIFGYTLNWQQISKAYRTEKKFTCERCNIKIVNSYDKRFIHVHHKNGNKLINNKDNLECLCILCHSKIDETHEHNFEKNRMKTELKNFIQKYSSDLKKNGSKYI
jgi:hypothetical protein